MALHYTSSKNQDCNLTMQPS